MKEPILSREEVLDALTVPGLNVEAALEPREVGLLCGAIIDLLEKLCGEPVAYTSEDGLRLLSSAEEICVWAPDSPLRRQRDIPLYTLKDRQS